MNFTGHCGPTQQGWRRSGETADHNILWRRALQKHRVNKRITHQARNSEHGGEYINGDC